VDTPNSVLTGAPGKRTMIISVPRLGGPRRKDNVMTTPATRRPGLVTLLVVLVVISGILALIGGVLLLIVGIGTGIDVDGMTGGVVIALAILTILVGVVYLAVAKGLRRKPAQPDYRRDRHGDQPGRQRLHRVRPHRQCSDVGDQRHPLRGYRARDPVLAQSDRVLFPSPVATRSAGASRLIAIGGV